MEYHAIPSRIIVKPEGEPIFSEMATVIEIEDEAAGPFVRISQSTSDNPKHVSVDVEEWPLIRDAIQQMLNVAQGLDADKLPLPPNAGNNRTEPGTGELPVD